MSYYTTIRLPPSTEYVTHTEVFRQTVYTTYYYTLTNTVTQIPTVYITTSMTVPITETVTHTELFRQTTYEVVTHTVPYTTYEPITLTHTVELSIPQSELSSFESELGRLELQLSGVTSLSEIISLLSKYSDLRSKYTSFGVRLPEFESRLDKVRTEIQNNIQKYVQSELSGLSPEDPKSIQTIQSLKLLFSGISVKYGVDVSHVLNILTSKEMELMRLSKELERTTLEYLKRRDVNFIDDLASRVARVFTLAEFLSRDVWMKLRENLELSDDVLRMISKYMRGSELSDDELRKLSTVYQKLKNANIYDPSITNFISRVGVQYADGVPIYTYADYERELKEKIVRGEVPDVTPGRRVVLGLQESLKIADVLGQGYQAIYNFLKERGVPSVIASAIATALASAGTIALSAVPVVGTPLALGLVGVSLANFFSQMVEYFSDPYESSLITEEFSKLLDPSKVDDPKLRERYEKEREELISTLVGTIAGVGAVVGIARSMPKLAEYLSKLIASKNPKLAEKIASIGKTLSYTEAIAKKQNWEIRLDPTTNELLIARYEAGVLRPIAKLPSNEYLLVLTKESPDDMLRLVEGLVRITGKADVSDELRLVTQKLLDTLSKHNIQPTSTVVRDSLTKYNEYLSKLIQALPDELRGKSLTEIAKEVTFVKVGDKLTPSVDLGEKISLFIGDKVLTTSKGALLSVETVDRLGKLGIFDDVVDMLSKGVSGKGVVVRPDKGLIAEVFTDKIVITRGIQKEVLPLSDVKYLVEGRKLLESYDPTIIKALSTAITAEHMITAPPTPTITYPEILKQTEGMVKSLAEKLGSNYQSITLATKGKTAYTYVADDIVRTTDDNVLLTSLHDFIFAKDVNTLKKILGEIPEYKRLTLYQLKLSKPTTELLNKYLDMGKPISVDDLRNTISTAVREASGTTLTELKQLQLILEGKPTVVIPVIVSSTDEGVVIGVASAVALDKLSSEAIKELGVNERVVTDGLKQVYVESTQLIPITEVVEEVKPVLIPDLFDVYVTDSDVARLSPRYVDVPYNVPVIQPVEKVEVVSVPDGFGVPIEVSENVVLRPHYISREHDVPVVVPREEVKLFFIPTSSEVFIGDEDEFKLRPHYVDVLYNIPVTQPVEKTQPVLISETVTDSFRSEEDVQLKAEYVDIPYTVPIVETETKTELRHIPEELIMSLVGRQLANVVVTPVEVDVLKEVYLPYKEPLPLPPLPPHLAVGAVPGVPEAHPKPEEEITPAVIKPKPKEIEKVVL